MRTAHPLSPLGSTGQSGPLEPWLTVQLVSRHQGVRRHSIIMSIITPDLVEWLVADPQVSSSWRTIAKHLSLSSYIPSLEVSRRNRRTDSQRMKELLIIWRSVRPSSYTLETLLDMLDILGMKGMYEWIQLMTKDRLSPTSLHTYVFTKINCSQRSSLTEVRSDRIGRSITPRPQSCYYSSSVASRTTPHSLNSTPSHSRPLSAMSDDLDSSLPYSRSSISPLPHTRSTGSYSPYNLKTSPPLLHYTLQYKKDPVPTPPGSDSGVFRTLYRPDCIKGRAGKTKQTSSPNCFRHSSYNPVIEINTVSANLDTIEESPKTELKQFDEAFAEYKDGKCGNIKVGETDKYFDNLVALIEEAARGLEL